MTECSERDSDSDNSQEDHNELIKFTFEKETKKTANLWDDAFIAAAKKPSSWLVWVVGITWAIQIMAESTGSDLEKIIHPLRFIAVVSLLGFFLTKFITEIESASIAVGGDVTTANAVGKLLRISVTITVILSVLQTLGFSISGVLAFGGVGGIAVGFAAKDLLANFFGGLMLSSSGISSRVFELQSAAENNNDGTPAMFARSFREVFESFSKFS